MTMVGTFTIPLALFFGLFAIAFGADIWISSLKKATKVKSDRLSFSAQRAVAIAFVFTGGYMLTSVVIGFFS